MAAQSDGTPVVSWESFQDLGVCCSLPSVEQDDSRSRADAGEKRSGGLLTCCYSSRSRIAWDRAAVRASRATDKLNGSLEHQQALADQDASEDHDALTVEMHSPLSSSGRPLPSAEMSTPLGPIN